jgi:serine/threonine-protein kinase HipA
MEVIDFFRLGKPRALEIIEKVKTSVRNWRVVATKFNVPKAEQELKSKAFQRADN